MKKQYYVYIMTNQADRVLYTGVTNNLLNRVYQHKNKTTAGSKQRYNANKLVYYEIFTDLQEAIAREKQVKGGSRAKKIEMIDRFNTEWLDLYEELI